VSAVAARWHLSLPNSTCRTETNRTELIVVPKSADHALLQLLDVASELYVCQAVQN
jgi:hypothetical protein